MTSRTIGMTVCALAGVLAAGCSQNSSTLQTASVAPDKAIAQNQPKLDPVCVSLTNQIDTLRKEGAVERLERASTGKSATVQVKRASLVKQAELNKAFADYQTSCGPAALRPMTAQAAPAAVAPVTATTAPAAAKQAAAAAAPAAAAAAPAAAAAAQAVTKQ